MYTLRNELEADFVGTLKKVAQLGFDGVELAGYGGMSVTELKSLLDELGLQAPSSHVPLEQLEKNLDKVIEEQKILGSQYIVVPYIMPENQNEDYYYSLISFLKTANAKCNEQGLTLCYHNHDFELEKLSDGRKVLEAILEETSVSTEFDVYWLTKAGEDPVDWLTRYRDRTPLVHLKDMTLDDERFFAELGTGGVNVESILQTGKEQNVKWWIVEQDESRRTPLESIEISINYLKNII
ncbi:MULTISPECIES: sugar phosphate isomerase/epimerase family protein [Sutcliffiella]|uniref:sugar phosphate isomerase/epimerase family protein n=1 Tax=Sutcliffiella TaxID=2837511 RepID=UPI000A636EC2|nr:MULTISPECIES: sugar phosphate isomerase/epimerase [Sutcliffiella]WBL15822.1 sugar phosphate isomerase/epimerase [Sutcliffiella sp. NC1]